MHAAPEPLRDRGPADRGGARAVRSAPELAGTGFDADAGTGWLLATVPVIGGDSITLDFELADAADGVFDSLVLIDAAGFLAQPAPGDDLTVQLMWPQ